MQNVRFAEKRPKDGCKFPGAVLGIEPVNFCLRGGIGDDIHKGQPKKIL